MPMVKILSLFLVRMIKDVVCTLLYVCGTSQLFFVMSCLTLHCKHLEEVILQNAQVIKGVEWSASYRGISDLHLLEGSTTRSKCTGQEIYLSILPKFTAFPIEFLIQCTYSCGHVYAGQTKGRMPSTILKLILISSTSSDSNNCRLLFSWGKTADIIS